MAKVSKKQAAKAAAILTEEKVVKKNKKPAPTEFPHGDNEDEEVVQIIEENFIDGLDEPSTVHPGSASHTDGNEPSQPTPAKKDTKIKAHGKPDEFGFGDQTQSSFILKYLREGTYTKAEILDAFVKHFGEPGGGKPEADRKKSSASVFFSDVAKPFGTYHASRSLIILTGEGDKMSLEPKRLAIVEQAIREGILVTLKGFNMKAHPAKVATVLKKYNLPTE